jgi:hypothetical protein
VNFGAHARTQLGDVSGYPRIVRGNAGAAVRVRGGCTQSKNIQGNRRFKLERTENTGCVA